MVELRTILLAEDNPKDVKDKEILLNLQMKKSILPFKKE